MRCSIHGAVLWVLYGCCTACLTVVHTDASRPPRLCAVVPCRSSCRSPVLGVCLRAGALGGRLDHTLSNLNTLYCYRHLNMALWGDGNLVRLLRAGTARIQPARAEGPTCGLVPLARPATASSTGLKWDLDNTHVSRAAL